ncbi:MAG: acyl-CoA thioesterase [Thermodesulfobacteriota bacterium]
MKPETPKRFEIMLAVPFHDLDPLQVVWHGNYFKYFDMARFALLKNCGVDLHAYSLENQIIFPITRTSTKYIIPLRYQDEFSCRATVTEARYKISLDFEIRLVRSNTVCTKGKSEQVAVKMPEMELLFEIPEDIRMALEAS